ncbi:MAG: hypothetical protein OEY66_08420 [Gammaproteobacteria bacterium]|nr:hypothetical protein [Gammaproteobacteria bacterium]
MIKKLPGTVLFFFMAGMVYCAYEYYENNKVIDWPTTFEIQRTFNQSIEWLVVNDLKNKNNHNSALWWMLKEASEISDDKKLTDIYQQYKKQYLDANSPNVWTPYFRKYYRPYVPDITAFLSYKPYQLFFVYALSCDKALARETIIQDQHEADFCGLHYLSPRCVTHQLMSVRLMQDRSCGDDKQLAALSQSLQEIIIDELTYDFRVTDSYLQRVLALAEAGNYEAIKPVWVQRIIDAQNEDGGWNDMHPVIPLGNSALGWTSLLPGYASNESNFHATAQGVWLMALLLQHEQE